ncbi:hypothetical protein FNF27_04171 [Cafeteria roenbergensis]|uniref:Uncharacterized protein n=1 Tax=Cafeteria roenbergensis TaxID=33653 RepID=A0A5A8CE46_CAFRO|nr:hypothetical protein FNF29_04700 [Cafeteria roenbergensis]KAA0159279.1 hypothetical protein FNF28_05914 [Cafeteria roenbergensis]KAA0174378.1 hypothetical protein FNF27_04171 [Cafeteria roenbergensis]|eukprot:KAA0151225.1 hypothetical protein FNF29_04700 [Cafeteria roenbergensis]
MYRWAQCYPEGRPSSAAQAGHAVSDSKAAGDAGDEEDEDAFNIFGPGSLPPPLPHTQASLARVRPVRRPRLMRLSPS